MINISDEEKKLLQSLSILYVEDDELMAKETAGIFESLCKSVDSCSNGQEGLIQYTTKLYDIVITDINMPVMDGLSMSYEIKQINPDQHIIITSAYSDSEYFIKCLELGVDGFIAKPINIEYILKTLLKVAKSVREKQELAEYKNNLEEMLEKKTQEILKGYNTDSNTELRNCSVFKKLLKTGKTLNLTLLNIDNFSNVNDAYGVEYGDLTLQKIAEFLKMFKFKDIDIYKLESDEFALVDAKNLDTQKSVEMAEFIISFFNETEVELEEELDVNISFSIGIAIGSGISVLNKARASIKELREHTRGTYKVYDMKSKYMREQQDNVYWVKTIQDSIAEDSVVAFFQPIINNHTGKIEKYECLARIFDDGEYVSPFHFMEAAKETRLISLITQSMIKQSCKIFSKTEYEFSVNITNDDLQMEYLEGYLLRNCEKFNINPNRIVLELLEDIPTLEKGSILKQLNSLREKGFKLAIDDFGSESSNFSRLMEFDADYLKIDGAFIKNILTDEKSQNITEGIVFIAHKNGIKVIAEFIHNAEVQEKIKSLGIDYSQGYFHGAPSKELI